MLSSQTVKQGKPFRILSATPADIPAFTTLTTEAFLGDTNTILKDYLRGRRPLGNISMPCDHFKGYMREDMKDRVEIFKAVENRDGAEERILGYCVWGKWNLKGDKKNPEGLPDPRLSQEYYNPPPLKSSATSLEKLEYLQSTHLAKFQLTHNPWSYDLPVSYIIGIAVSPSAQGSGIGQALMDIGKKWADEYGSYAWVHSSMSGWGAFRKAGFREAGRLKIDLDEYADGVEWEGAEEGEEDNMEEIGKGFGKYLFRCGVYGTYWGEFSDEGEKGKI